MVAFRYVYLVHGYKRAYSSLFLQEQIKDTIIRASGGQAPTLLLLLMLMCFIRKMHVGP